MFFNLSQPSPHLQCLYVDNANRLLAASMLDKSAYIYDLDDPIPRAEYKGHQVSHSLLRSMFTLHACCSAITCPASATAQLAYAAAVCLDRSTLHLQLLSWLLRLLFVLTVQPSSVPAGHHPCDILPA